MYWPDISSHGLGSFHSKFKRLSRQAGRHHLVEFRPSMIRHIPQSSFASTASFSIGETFWILFCFCLCITHRRPCLYHNSQVNTRKESIIMVVCTLFTLGKWTFSILCFIDAWIRGTRSSIGSIFQPRVLISLAVPVNLWPFRARLQTWVLSSLKNT
jgi:hypothetical protein